MEMNVIENSWNAIAAEGDISIIVLKLLIPAVHGLMAEMAE